jgi:hypothetical protein
MYAPSCAAGALESDFALDMASQRWYDPSACNAAIVRIERS